MRQVYSDVEEIVTFFNKAQNKIAQLGDFLVEDLSEIQDEDLLLDLSDFLETLDSPYCNLLIPTVIRDIHYWNKRANLYSIPFIQITDYVVNIVTGGGSGSPDLGDLETTIRDILSRFPHNQLTSLQGGTTSERYHVSKEMYDWVVCQMAKSPCPDIIQPTVGLVVSSNGILWPSGYYELGTSITSNVLLGSYQLNSGITLLAARYKRNGVVLSGSQVSNPTSINSYSDSTSVVVDTTYSFEADFQRGGTKTASKTIAFKAPMHYGILRNNLITSTNIRGLTKDVRAKGYVELTYTLPIGNTLLPHDSAFAPIVEFPLEFGIPSSVKVLEYDFKSDWVFTQTTNILQDGSTVDVIRGVYSTAFEGTTTFKFSF